MREIEPEDVIGPPTKVQILRNEIRLDAKAGQSYLLRHSSFHGWRAYQNGKRLSIVDAQPGMIVRGECDGEIVLPYSCWHYWL